MGVLFEPRGQRRVLASNLLRNVRLWDGRVPRGLHVREQLKDKWRHKRLECRSRHGLVLNWFPCRRSDGRHNLQASVTVEPFGDCGFFFLTLSTHLVHFQALGSADVVLLACGVCDHSWFTQHQLDKVGRYHDGRQGLLRQRWRQPHDPCPAGQQPEW